MGKFLISVVSFLVLGEIKAASENDRFLSLPQKKLCDNREWTLRIPCPLKDSILF